MSCPSSTPPRRRALEVALLIRDGGDRPLDPRAVNVAVRSAVQLLAEHGPLVIAIDDIQWLDASSASAVGFALRRLDGSNVTLLLARRLGVEVGGPIESSLERRRDRACRHRAAQPRRDPRAPASAAGRPFARPTLLRIHDVSGGNPFYALELGRSVAAAESTGPAVEPLVVPTGLEALVSARLEGFDGQTREALHLCAAQARLTPAQLLGLGIDGDALQPAIEGQVIEVTDGGVRYTHPLLASVLYQGLPAVERRRVHGVLAGVVDDPLGRARHLALSTDSPDAGVAAVLEEAAAAAAGAGRTDRGIRARRARASPDAAGSRRRSLSTIAGRSANAPRSRRRRPSPSARRRARGRTHRQAGCAPRRSCWRPRFWIHPGRRFSCFEQRFARRPESQASRPRSSSDSACTCASRTASPRRASHARAAVELAEQSGEDDVRAEAIAGLAIVRFNAGDPDARALAERAVKLGTASGDERAALIAGMSLAHVLLWSRELERARTLLEGICTEWGDRDERMLANALWYLSLVELHAGRLSLASELRRAGP